MNKKKAISEILIAMLLTGILSSIFIVQVKASGTAILSPQGKIYHVNASIPLTYTVSGPASWIGYSLDGQLNLTINGNTTLPILPDGWHEVVVYAMDALGNMEASPARNFAVDTIAPTGSIMINGGATSTMSTQVTLTLLAEDATSGVSQMRFFEAAWGDWEEYATTKRWEFKSAGGYMTVYVQFRDKAGLVSKPYPANVFLGDPLPPSGPMLEPAPFKEIPKETSEELPEETPDNHSGKTPATVAPKETSPAPTPQTASMGDWYFVPEVVGMIIAIIAVVIILFWKSKRRQAYSGLTQSSPSAGLQAKNKKMEKKNEG